jgi:CO/xanthine dehydrogenase FAD-binding subunit
VQNQERETVVEILQPGSWSEALETRRAHPEAKPIAGGTDVMVQLNFDHIRPAALLDLSRVSELTNWSREGGWLRIGAGVPYTRLIAELGDDVPGLAIAARTVGSPQIRNRGTVGGNLATSSPAGDGLPPLFAAGAEVELASVDGSRRVPVADFITGPKRNSMARDELIAAFWIKPSDGPQEFSKVGTRNAMVIAVCSFALNISRRRRAITTCIGSSGPTPIRATEAEEFIAGVLEEHALWEAPAPLSASTLAHFGALVGEAARPIDDVRGTADYRRHALRVLGRRALTRAWKRHVEEVTR